MKLTELHGNGGRPKAKLSKFAILPLQSSLDLQRHTAASPPGLSHAHPIDDGSSLLYELVVAQQLPTVNLSSTLLSKFCSAQAQELLTQFMRRRYRAFIGLHQLASFAFFGVMLAENEALRTGFACASFVGVLPVFAMILFLSIDIIRLMSSTYEFWFMTALSLLHWGCVALILRDARVPVLYVSWLSLQTVIMIDANFRTFPAATRSVIVAIPSMATLGVCCAFKVVSGAHFDPVSVGKIELFPADVVVFTTSTLVIFMAKKVYFKWTRKHQTFPGWQCIPCVVLRSTLKYAAVHQVARRTATATTASIEHIQLQHFEQRLRLASGSLINLQPRRLLIPLKFFLESWKPWQLRVLYLVGVTGFICTSGAWLLSLSDSPNSSYLAVTSIVGAACTFIFVLTFGLMLQHEVMWAMVFNFDYMFSVMQGHIFMLCLGSMLQWDVHRFLAVVSWNAWFQWVLFQDGLIPIVKERLRYKKRCAAPVMALLLLGFVPLLIRIIDDRSLFMDSMIVNFHISGSHDYKLHVKGVALQRIVTILCWSARLVYGLSYTLEDELLFIRGPVEYLSPCDVFPE